MSLPPLPCPFCGGEPTFGYRGMNAGANVIECNNEGCPCLPFTNALSHAEAIAAWNTRAASGMEARQGGNEVPSEGRQPGGVAETP